MEEASQAEELQVHMNKKHLIFAGLLILSFAVGRYSVSVNRSTQIDETTKTKTDTTIVKVKEPNGKETTTTIIKERETTKKELNQVEISKKAILNVALLGAYNTNQNTTSYGISISKEFIGPITFGAYGLTDGIMGLSVGVNF